MGNKKAGRVCRSKTVKKTKTEAEQKRRYNSKEKKNPCEYACLTAQKKRGRNVGVSDDVEGEQLQCRKSLSGPFQGRDHGIVESGCRQSQLLGVTPIKLVLNSKSMKRSTYSKYELI